MKETLEMLAILILASMTLFSVAVVFAPESPNHSSIEG